jgi:hypothetical protein
LLVGDIGLPCGPDQTRRRSAVPPIRRLFHADLKVSALQPSVDTQTLFPRLPQKQPAGLLLPFSTPLLEKECHTLTLASIAQLFDPPRLHRPCGWTVRDPAIQIGLQLVDRTIHLLSRHQEHLPGSASGPSGGPYSSGLCALAKASSFACCRSAISCHRRDIWR